MSWMSYCYPEKYPKIIAVGHDVLLIFYLQLLCFQ